MSTGNARFSFQKNNMNAAIAMGKDQFGTTILSSKDPINIADGEDSEPVPHVNSLGDYVHNANLAEAPSMKAFLDDVKAGKFAQTSNPADEPQPIEPVPSTDISSLNDYASTLNVDEAEAVPNYDNSRPRRVFASAAKALVNFCVECGCGFGESEKFCPHCGCRRTTYTKPSS